MRKAIVMGLAVLVSVLFGNIAAAEDKVMFTPNEIKWKAGSASLPSGSEMAVIEGDPKGTGHVTIRLKFPPNVTLDPHTHGGAERVTVLSGTLYFALGDKLDKEAAKPLPAGSFFVIPKDQPMYGYTGDDGTVLQLNVEGPWTMTFVEDDKPMK